MYLMDILWFLVIVGGPIVLAIGFIYARNRRRQSRSEFEAGERATRRLYREDREDVPPRAGR